MGSLKPVCWRLCGYGCGMILATKEKTSGIVYWVHVRWAHFLPCKRAEFNSKMDAALQKGEAGQCVFGRIILVIVHHRLADSNHLVFAVSRGPYKQCPNGGCKAPTFLPGRTCVTWAPNISFKEVEAWWQDIIHRPCMQLEPSIVRFHCCLTNTVQGFTHLLGTRTSANCQL